MSNQLEIEIATAEELAQAEAILVAAKDEASNETEERITCLMEGTLLLAKELRRLADEGIVTELSS
jgi:hypothetical protein